MKNRIITQSQSISSKDIHYKGENITLYRNKGNTTSTDRPKWNHQQWDESMPNASRYDAPRHKITSAVFLSKVQGLNLVGREKNTQIQIHIQGTKLAYILQKCQGHKRQRKPEEHWFKLKEAKRFISNSWSWTELWTRKYFFFAIKNVMRTTG